MDETGVAGDRRKEEMRRRIRVATNSVGEVWSYGGPRTSRPYLAKDRAGPAPTKFGIAVVNGSRALRSMIGALLGFLIVASSGAAELDRVGDNQSAQHLVITVNKSRSIRISRPFTRAVVAAPEIADV